MADQLSFLWSSRRSSMNFCCHLERRGQGREASKDWWLGVDLMQMIVDDVSHYCMGRWMFRWRSLIGYNRRACQARSEPTNLVSTSWVFYSTQVISWACILQYNISTPASVELPAFLTQEQRRSMGYRRPGYRRQFCRSPQVAGCLMTPYRPHFCRYHPDFCFPSWMPPAAFRCLPLASRYATAQEENTPLQKFSCRRGAWICTAF